MVRGRTTAPVGLVLGHEITGEVVEVGPDVEFVKVRAVSLYLSLSCSRLQFAGRRSLLGSVQHCLRSLCQLQGGQNRYAKTKKKKNKIL
jgi:threonine dehydrogenase-like Zn-dependent dehydrogenase